MCAVHARTDVLHKEYQKLCVRVTAVSVLLLHRSASSTACVCMRMCTAYTQTNRHCVCRSMRFSPSASECCVEIECATNFTLIHSTIFTSSFAMLIRLLHGTVQNGILTYPSQILIIYLIGRHSNPNIMQTFHSFFIFIFIHAKINNIYTVHLMNIFYQFRTKSLSL